MQPRDGAYKGTMATDGQGDRRWISRLRSDQQLAVTWLEMRVGVRWLRGS
jgi:hypothetical protein